MTVGSYRRPPALASWNIVKLGNIPAALREGEVVWSEDPGFTIRSCDSDPARYSVEFSETANFSISMAKREICISGFSPELNSKTVEHLLADQILPRVLAHEGHLVLHASSVLTPTGAFVFAGLSGRGKSTLAASLHEAGFALLGDDAIVISVERDGARCRPIYRSLRLFEDSIRSVFTKMPETEHVAHYTTKRKVVNLDENGYSEVPKRVSAMFFLESSGAASIDLHRVSAVEACMAIIEHSFWLDPTDRDQARSRLLKAGAIAPHFPVFRLDFPRDYLRLREVHEAILGAIDDENFRVVLGR